MPKVLTYTLAWSSSIKAYELYETRNRGISGIVPDNPEWFAWLDQVSSFVFSGKTGHYTARKEHKQRGGHYWYAYLTTGGRLTKKYLGKSVDVTLAQLEHIAGILSAQSETQMPPPASPAASADTEMDTVLHPTARSLVTSSSG